MGHYYIPKDKNLPVVLTNGFKSSLEVVQMMVLLGLDLPVMATKTNVKKGDLRGYPQPTYMLNQCLEKLETRWRLEHVTLRISSFNGELQGVYFSEHGGGIWVSALETPWLNYAREWGPKISYDISKELKKVERFMIGKLKNAIEKIVRGLPNEVLGEEGPTGPKFKDMWSGDERG
ncbi:hypothetical protein HAX54_031216 [Datura stramonium]|uniref:Uncharacterized protein n=1 Tax=Datura stramonium TaxID=4076 RepID=A0ABS8VBP8_DATST|nr:hypothetical protein [Datura stramonium]